MSLKSTARVESEKRATAALGRFIRKYGKVRAVAMVTVAGRVLEACDLGDDWEQSRDMLYDIFKVCGDLQAINQGVVH